jgi:transposase
MLANRCALDLSCAQARVAYLRRDGLRKLTSRLAATFGTVVVEDLHVAGVLRNRSLAKHLAGAGFAQIRRRLADKMLWSGGWLLVADRWYPSSKTCSVCGIAKTKLALSDREYSCAACGLVLGRDHNAALNSTWSRPEDPRTRAGGCET